MEAAGELVRDLVFVGGGHSHALALRMMAMRPIEGLRITLVSPASHTPYSGMLPGLVAGHYGFEDTHIDLARLCQWANVRFIAAEVNGLDPASRLLSLAGRPPLAYDLVSIDIGSQPELDSVPGARAYSVPVKPVAGLWQRWQALYARLQAQPSAQAHRICVVGGGAGSVELALAMAHRLKGKAVSVELLCGASQILLNYNAGARRAVMAALARHGVEVLLDARVSEVEPDCLALADGRRRVFDDLFWCTGAAAAPWVAASGLATDAQGFLAVRDTLQSLDNDRVLGAGDIATQVNHPRPKAGVYAVRQGPVLAHNLRALLLGKPLREHRPQQRFLSLVSLGDKMATADKGPFSVSGQWVWRWKDRIDREFMTRFADLPLSMPTRSWGSLSESAEVPQAPCGGCGAKVGADALGAALADLALEYPRHCPAQGDDASPIPAGGSTCVVQSLDMLRQIVADDWQMGRIAANHALSDLYACGARPVSALAAVTLPFASPQVLRRDLRQLIGGALREFAPVECSLQGGHSMQGSELGIGFVVNGVPMAPDGRLLPKQGLIPGDCLVLTKSLGTGVLFAAHMQLRADGRDVATALDSMLVSNMAAAELAVSHDATACTDITGFGLLGHLLEMLGEDLGVELQLERLPVLPGALEHLRSGVRSTMHEPNLRSGEAALDLDGARAGAARLNMLFDPQTSGGLLIGIPAGSADALCASLRQCGYPDTEVIGKVVARESATQVRVY